MSLVSAKPAIPDPQFAQVAAYGEGAIVPRMLALASAMRVVDPSLGSHLRAYRRTSEARAGEADWKWVLTHDGRPLPKSGVMDDPKAVDFFEALHETLPDCARIEVSSLRTRAGASHQSLATQAVAEAHRSAVLDIHEKSLSEMEDAYAITTALRVRENDFMRFPDIAQRAMLSQPSAASAADLSSELPSVRLRARLQRARATLAEDFEKASPGMRAALLEDIAALNASPTPVPGQSFEELFQHGWLGYAYSRGAKGWETFLTEKAGCSPFAHYAGVSPLVLAIANNDPRALRAIVEAGGSANALLQGWPRLFDDKNQQELESAGGSPVTPLMLAARLGKPAALVELLGQGGEVNLANSNGDTALHFAAGAGSDACVRALLLAGASASATNDAGLTPSDCVPYSPLLRSVKDMLDLAAGNASQPASPASSLAAAVRQQSKPSRRLAGDPTLWRARSPRQH